jgi:gp16 family phage-associated protein
MAVKTIEEVKKEFDRKGLSFSTWAKNHGLRPGAVYDVISGRQAGRRGQAHKVAVLLGLKEGELPDNYQRSA